MPKPQPNPDDWQQAAAVRPDIIILVRAFLAHLRREHGLSDEEVMERVQTVCRQPHPATSPVEQGAEEAIGT